MKSFAVGILSALLILGAGATVLAQQTPTPPGATDQAKPGDTATSAPEPSPKVDVPKTVPPTPGAPSAAVDVPGRAGEATGAPGVDVAASPRTERPTRILGLDPTTAALLGAGILIVVIVALVAMARNDTTATSRTDFDRDRRL